MIDVLFILPPFVSDRCPSMALSLFKTVLYQNNISCEILYANILFKKELPFLLYDKIAVSDNTHLLSEFIFSSSAFKKDNTLKNAHAEFHKKYKDKKFKTAIYNEHISISEIEQCITSIESHRKELKRLILQKKPKIVGIQISYNQICYSIVLAELIKSIDEKIIITAGGYNCQMPMAEEIVSLTNDIDYIFSGEADSAFPEFCLNVKKNILPQEKIIVCGIEEYLDEHPLPDFSDYLQQSSQIPFYSVTRWLPIENSRGCWWGEQSQCSFCGGNGNAISYRKKSNTVISRQMKNITSLYNSEKIYPTDIINPPNFTEILSRSESSLASDLYYEMRPTVPFEELYMYKKAGLLLCQPGIETFNDTLLSILNKGTSAVKNIEFLRNCISLNITPAWLFLYAIPGENLEAYVDMMKFLPSLIHLPPPFEFTRIAIQRFSLFFQKPEKFNIRHIKPLDEYQYIFPQTADISKLAIYFAGDYQTIEDMGNITNNFHKYIQSWQQQYRIKRPLLHIVILSPFYSFIIDTRKIEVQYKLLSLNEFTIIEFLMEPKNEKEVECFIKEHSLQDELSSLLQEQTIMRIGGRYISLPTDHYREYTIQQKGNHLLEELFEYDSFDHESFINDLKGDDNFSTFKLSPKKFLENYTLYISEKHEDFIKKQLESIFL